MTQLNTPYPATAYLTGFLRSRGEDAVQADPAIELVLRLLSREGLKRVRERILSGGPGVSPGGGQRKTRGKSAKHSERVAFFLERFEDYARVIDPAIRFLQGRDPSLALRIASREFLPEGARFMALDALSAMDGEGDAQLGWAFGALGIQDRAKYLASLLVDDLADLIGEAIDPKFQLSRYGEKLAASQPTYDPLREALDHADRAPTLVDEMLGEITRELLDRHAPAVLCLTVPFPGNVYGALRMARVAREHRPEVRIVMGGGYVNTELRELKDPRVFDEVDYITLDDGERPLLCILEGLREAVPREGLPRRGLLRTFVRVGEGKDARVALISDSQAHDIPLSQTGTPTYDGLPLGSYLSILEMLNPMHRIWSDGRWNKLTLAHGCYWKKCSFCDVTLDYIGRYEPIAGSGPSASQGADLLVDRIEAIVQETGQTGFHFVDEAAPPATLRALADRLIARGVMISWWGNIRFEKSFTPELCQLLARSGCVAVSGGLEVASPRLLKLINKGVTVEQVERVTRAFADAGVMVHAYLMYGFPTQTEQETIESLERVRGLFESGSIQSAFWHRFSVTAHSPIGKNPAAFGITIPKEPAVSFARNDLAFVDPTGVDHDRLGRGLNRALYNYMHGLGFETPVEEWFDEP